MNRVWNAPATFSINGKSDGHSRFDAPTQVDVPRYVDELFARLKGLPGFGELLAGIEKLWSGERDELLIVRPGADRGSPS